MNENVVLFKPREWRGSDHKRCEGKVPLSKKECFTPTEMANEINNYDKGTVTQMDKKFSFFWIFLE